VRQPTNRPVSTHANPPSAGRLIAAAKAEQAALAGPQISPEEQALDAASTRCSAWERGWKWGR
jgi:hypothetical protein